MTTYKHQHFTIINSPDDSVVVELSVKSTFHFEQVMQILKEAEEKINATFKELWRCDER